ncbi:hypothetical protein HX109_10510 [Galbibacter sp. BG1]|uniref:alpha-L-arabinofuranosidase C-terminal domain-containing protein n=1 Tax=Galbibacter sp. BG1 TaxID=1170699 RepID=UPI0015BC38F8|nr:alpha-L-arabinofuranosidase C-terminal domain-containing protein [Galbibacter sp. BG1]QLE01966.1 hypothetical protein HX109_10510 [Galbibacter sp. BG1]
MRTTLSILALITITLLQAQNTTPDTAVLKVNFKKTQPLNHLLFGHFLEKCNWGGETGADTGWDKQNNALREDVGKLLDSIEPPIVRFPGGTDIDYYQWTELVDNAYDRENPERPPYDGRDGNVISQNELGFDEFLSLSEKLSFEPLLVVNLGDAYFKKKTVEEAASYAASLVAYCNAPIDANLPEKYLKWAQLRLKNGRKEPYNVKYFQIGNEVWVFDKEKMGRNKKLEKSFVEEYYKILETYIAEMRSVDENIKIIIEGNLTGFSTTARQYLGDSFDLLAYHHYTPWGMTEALNKKGESVEVSDEELYYAFVSVPSFKKETGLSYIDDIVFTTLLEKDIPIAMTEWNWNGWISGDLKKAGHKDSKMAQGIGAASYLHAMMRNSDAIKLANQSMLIGNSWGINTIHIDKKTNKAEIFPTGLATMLYGKNHGDRVAESQLQNSDYFEQPYKVGTLNPSDKVNFLDAVVSEDDQSIYVHLINRDYKNTRKVQLDLGKTTVTDQAEQKTLTGAIYPENEDIASINTKILNFEKDEKVIELAPHSINIIVLDKE